MKKALEVLNSFKTNNYPINFLYLTVQQSDKEFNKMVYVEKYKNNTFTQIATKPISKIIKPFKNDK